MGDAADMAMDIEMGLADDAGIPYDLPDERKPTRPRDLSNMQRAVYESVPDDWTGVTGIQEYLRYTSASHLNLTFDSIKSLLRWLARKGLISERKKSNRRQYRKLHANRQTSPKHDRLPRSDESQQTRDDSTHSSGSAEVGTDL